MKFNTVKFKIGILFVAILGLLLVVYSTYLFFTLYFTLYEEIDRELIEKAKEVAKAVDLYIKRYSLDGSDVASAVKKAIVFEELPDPDELDFVQERWLQIADILNLKDNYIEFIDPENGISVRSKNLGRTILPLDDRMIDGFKEGNPVYGNAKLSNLKVRTVTFPQITEGGLLFAVQVGTSLKPVVHILRNRLLHILASIPLILVGSSLFGRFFASRLLKPVFDITNTARAITDENLSEKVSEEGVDEEMKHLVAAFNDMISRLERSFKAISEFSANAAHEIKTPLTIIKGESEIALIRDRSRNEYKKAIGVIGEEADRMLKVIDDLFLLTKLDFPEKAFTFEEFDLIDLLKGILALSGPLAMKKKISVTLNKKLDLLLIRGDRLHVRRLFINILDNAIKYTRERGTIRVDITREKDEAMVAISDSGLGIGEKDLPRIFDRFFRSKLTDYKTAQGTGLGLSIVKSIVEAHNGNIEVESTPGLGSTFTVHLPCSTASPAARWVKDF